MKIQASRESFFIAVRKKDFCSRKKICKQILLRGGL